MLDRIGGSYLELHIDIPRQRGTCKQARSFAVYMKAVYMKIWHERTTPYRLAVQVSVNVWCLMPLQHIAKCAMFDCCMFTTLLQAPQYNMQAQYRDPDRCQLAYVVVRIMTLAVIQ